MSHPLIRPLAMGAAFAALLLSFVPAAPARAQVLDPIQYTLAPGAAFEYGCFGPCACPVLFVGPLKGSFTFYRPGIDPSSTHYELLNIDWSYTEPDSATAAPRVHHVSGSGTLDYGGEVAITARMVLDVSFDGAPAHRFDSGVVPVSVALPAIDVLTHSNLIGCRDSVLRVVADPGHVADVAPGAVARLLSAPSPDPSRGLVRFILTLPAAAQVRVEVLDVSGRVVATLRDGRFDAGSQPLEWDGRDARGVPVGAGVYWVRARAGDRVDRRRVVRLAP